jgi:NAD(P)-dependent dehydrogenase (short-subunit alcohol dehydrogenase family)
VKPIDFGLDGETAIVTGGGSRTDDIGTGRGAAIMLARAGMNVALVDRDEAAAERTREMIADEGGVAEVYVGDVGNEADCRQIVGAVVERFGSLRVLVNNVGVAGPPGTAVDVDVEAWDAGMRVNLTSMVLMSRYAIPAMIARGGGSIVHMTSAAGILGGHPALLYATSKGAIINLTRAMAAQHGPDGIRVNCVAPGMVYTSFVIARGMSDEMRANRREQSLLKTEGTGWDIGNGVLYLASDLARWVTGITLSIDAGITAATNLPTPPRELEAPGVLPA